MDDGSRLPWICAALLLLCAAYFAVAETAFASASRTHLRMAEDRGDRRAKKALYDGSSNERWKVVPNMLTNLMKNRIHPIDHFFAAGSGVS